MLISRMTNEERMQREANFDRNDHSEAPRFRKNVRR